MNDGQSRNIRISNNSPPPYDGILNEEMIGKRERFEDQNGAEYSDRLLNRDEFEYVLRRRRYYDSPEDIPPENTFLNRMHKLSKFKLERFLDKLNFWMKRINSQVKNETDYNKLGFFQKMKIKIARLIEKVTRVLHNKLSSNVKINKTTDDKGFSTNNPKDKFYYTDKNDWDNIKPVISEKNKGVYEYFNNN